MKAPQAGRPHMPGYGVPADRKGLLPWSWAKQRLARSHNYWIATTRPDGSPHVMVIWGLWMDEHFYFSTGREARKARNLAANPRCVVCNERADEAAVVEGVARILQDGATRKRFFRLYQRKYDFDMSGFLDEPVWEVAPVKAFALYEKGFPKRATRWQFSGR